MKKFILLFLLSIATMSGIRAQLPDGAIAPDWTMTDLDGNVHHLQDYLDEGKTVFIDMFATWCGPCWNYHQTHALANLYDQYGPNGTNQVMVFGIESDLATPTNCIYDIDCPSSQGDWTIGVPYPMIDCTPTNGGNFPSSYQLSYYPTIYGICPNGQIWEVGQRQLNGLVSFIGTCPQPPPLAVSYTKTDINCTLDPVGAINLSVSGGKSPYTYTWSNGASSEDLNNIAAGTYSCTVTDNKGDQVFTGTIVIEGPSSLMTVTNQSGVDATCEQPNGSVSVEVSGGDPGYTYTWSNGASTPTVSGLFEGTYSCNIIDSKGCSTSASVTIYNIPSPTVIVSTNGEQLSCSNSTVDINSNGSSTGPQYQYSWTTSNGHIVSDPLLHDITVDAPGLYVLTIFDTYLGCTNANFIQVSGASGLPIANAGSDDVLPCSGGQITLSGESSSTGTNFTYQWTTDDGNIVSDPNAITIDVDASGVYVLKVTNTSNGCTASDAVEVTIDNNIAYSSSVNQISCNGAANGSITIDQTNYTYEWSTGATTNSISGLSTGTYQVTISNSAGCTSQQSFTITQPAVLTAAYSGTDAQDANSNDGTATVNPAGGTSPYSYYWSNGATTQTISNLTPGLYSATITDSHGCTTTGSYSVNVQGCTLSAIADVTDAACYGSNTGSVTLNLSNVTGQATILWNTGATTSTLANVPAGSYNAVISDDGGCLTVVNVVIDQSSEIVLSAIDKVNPDCPNDQNGSISIEAEGGSGEYGYTWSTGATGSSVDGLAAGTYSVVITDGAGCTSTQSIILNSNDNEKPDLKLKTADIPLGTDGQVEVLFSMIDNGSSDNCSDISASLNPKQFNCDQLGAQSIEVTLKDAAGNKSVKMVTVNIVDATAPVWNNCPSVDYLANSCNGLIDLDLVYSDNCSEIHIQQVKGQDLKLEFPLGNTTQEYVIVDESGNSSTCAFVVHRDVELQLNSVYRDASCSQLGSIEIVGEGGTAPFTYVWSNAMEGSKNDVQPGNYTIQVTDNSGCTKELEITISGPYVYTVEDAVVTQPTEGNTNGSIDITLNGDGTGLSFNWDKDGVSFATTEDLSNLSKGIYTLKITDGNGCTFGPYVYNLTTSGYDKVLESALKVYPNPVQNVLTLEYDGKESKMNIQIVDGLGRKIITKDINLVNGKVQVATSTLTNGAYRMIINDGTRVAVKQFVVIK